MEYFSNLFTQSIASWQKQHDKELKSKMEYWKNNKDNISEDEKKEYYGYLGENAVIEKFKLCCQPMCIIHDLNIKYYDLKIQNDLIVIISNAILIIECKNWSGNFKVDEFGNFIKTKKFDLEANDYIDTCQSLFSPMAQSTEHYNLIKNIIMEQFYLTFEDEDIKKKCLDSLIPVVVMVNEKSVLDLSDAPQDMKDRIIRYDQINRFLEKFISNDNSLFSKYEMAKISDYLINLDIESEKKIIY